MDGNQVILNDCVWTITNAQCSANNIRRLFGGRNAKRAARIGRARTWPLAVMECSDTDSWQVILLRDSQKDERATVHGQPEVVQQMSRNNGVLRSWSLAAPGIHSQLTLRATVPVWFIVETTRHQTFRRQPNLGSPVTVIAAFRSSAFDGSSDPESWLRASREWQVENRVVALRLVRRRGRRERTGGLLALNGPSHRSTHSPAARRHSPLNLWSGVGGGLCGSKVTHRRQVEHGNIWLIWLLF